MLYRTNVNLELPPKPKAEVISRFDANEPLTTPSNQNEVVKGPADKATNKYLEERMKMYPHLVDNGIMRDTKLQKKEVQADLIDVRARIFRLA
jgi:hypothetical protein